MRADWRRAAGVPAISVRTTVVCESRERHCQDVSVASVLATYAGVAWATARKENGSRRRVDAD